MGSLRRQRGTVKMGKDIAPCNLLQTRWIRTNNGHDRLFLELFHRCPQRESSSTSTRHTECQQDIAYQARGTVMRRLRRGKAEVVQGRTQVGGMTRMRAPF